MPACARDSRLPSPFAQQHYFGKYAPEATVGKVPTSVAGRMACAGAPCISKVFGDGSRTNDGEGRRSGGKVVQAPSANM
eukprot:11840257-Alexandrium_andersonii.AAC.1